MVRDTASQKKEDVWLFWVHAATRARVVEGFRAIADAVKLPDRNKPNVDVFQLVGRWLSNVRNGKWFMVLDSADDIHVFFDTKEKAKEASSSNEEETEALWTYLPQSENGSILVTTRDRNLAFKVTGNHKDIIEFGPMDQNHALKLFEKKCDSDTDTDAGLALVEALEFIPLAISQAAAYIQQRRPRTSVRKYLDMFLRDEQNKYSLLDHEEGNLRRDKSAANSIITTCQISFDFIHSENPSATELLCLMSFFDCQGIPESLVQFDQLEVSNTQGGNATSNIEEPQFEEAVEMLTRYCLIKSTKTGDTFEMHSLVQLSTRKCLDVHGKTEDFKDSYIDRLARAFPEPDHTNREVCRMLFAHAEGAINHCPVGERSVLNWALILLNASCYAIQQVRWVTAEIMARKADTAIETLGKQSLIRIWALNLIGTALAKSRSHEEAESVMLQVVDMTKTALGTEHPVTLICMNNLAFTYLVNGRPEEAEVLCLQVQEMNNRPIDTDDDPRLSSMHNLGYAYLQQNRLIEAELSFLRLIELQKGMLGTDHPNTLQLDSMNSLAYVWDVLGRTDEAIKLMEECAQGCTRVLGPEHPDTKYSLTLLDYLRSKRLHEPEYSLQHRRVRWSTDRLRNLGRRWKMYIRELRS